VYTLSFESSGRTLGFLRSFFAQQTLPTDLKAHPDHVPHAVGDLGLKSPGEREEHTSRATLFKFFLVLAGISLLLRISYAGHLFQDDGFWFTAAEEILRGKALYREIYFDKPPGLPLVYAFLFKTFGAHILTIRLFTVVYSVAVAGVLYRFGSHLYCRRAGLLAAVMFVVFSTTYTTGHVQGLNTDFLMLLPYTAGAYLLVRCCFWSGTREQAVFRPRLLALLGGALVGVAFQINPKAAFDLAFFAVVVIVLGRIRREKGGTRGSLILVASALAGFVGGSLPFLAYLAGERSLAPYCQYVWAWGSRYAVYHGMWDLLVSALRQSAAYFALNNTLMVGLAFVVAKTLAASRATHDATARSKLAPGANFNRDFHSDLILLIWFAASYAGLALGGRFFGHYFFQIMPALCLIGARGLRGITFELQKRRTARLLLLPLLAAGFGFTIVRFHSRTPVLAADWLRGTRSAITEGWYHERLKHEERRVAAVVRELPGKEEAADQVGLEDMRPDGPRTGEGAGQADYLFIWGYRPEIYYWSGLLPASRYLSTQPLTGVPADMHYFDSENHRLLFDEATTAEAREQLVRDLKQTQPNFIIDELGAFNSGLSIESYPELREVMREYKYYVTTDRFVVYRKRDQRRKRGSSER
jgi:4-amino-4-deoxy-L-arabinose transferase-like glycosyltransferase